MQHKPKIYFHSEKMKKPRKPVVLITLQLFGYCLHDTVLDFHTIVLLLLGLLVLLLVRLVLSVKVVSVLLNSDRDLSREK